MSEWGLDTFVQFAAGLLVGGVSMRMVLRVFSHHEPTRRSLRARGAAEGQRAKLRDARADFARLLMAVNSRTGARK